mgnify:CR=1 FL=1
MAASSLWDFGAGTSVPESRISVPFAIKSTGLFMRFTRLRRINRMASSIPVTVTPSGYLLLEERENKAAPANIEIREDLLKLGWIVVDEENE